MQWNDDVLSVTDSIKSEMMGKMEEVVLDHFDADMSDFREYMHDKIKWERKQELAMPRWIPVTERLPEDKIPVNVVWVNHSPSLYYMNMKDKPFVATGIYCDGLWYWWSATTEDYLKEYGRCEWDRVDSAIEITHWQMLPEPPKEQDDEQTAKIV
jgi:hypothetical protein